MVSTEVFDFQIHILYTGVNAVYISNGNIGGIDLIHLHSDEHRVVLAVNAVPLSKTVSFTLTFAVSIVTSS